MRHDEKVELLRLVTVTWKLNKYFFSSRLVEFIKPILTNVQEHGHPFLNRLDVTK